MHRVSGKLYLTMKIISRRVEYSGWLVGPTHLSTLYRFEYS